MKKVVVSVLFAIIFASNVAEAQYLREGQIDPGLSGVEFDISKWIKGSEWCEDDNFFISRVKPKARFVNKFTQINKKLQPWWDWDYTSAYNSAKDYSYYSKKMLMWVPYGFSYSYATKSPFEILPNGIFNSEVFTMWQYVSTWGAWSDRFMRMPGNFADVAHKNGVAVATQSTTAYGANMETNGWGDLYEELGGTEENRNKVIEYLDYYGIDGIGYNSEFAGGYNAKGVPEIVELNKAISQHFEKKYGGEMKCFAAENIWYDGVTKTGGPTFDNGVSEETEIFFGSSEEKTSSFFLNYNWNANFNNNNNEYLPPTLEYAAKELGRNPFDVYATFDLQGGSPKLSGDGEINGRWQYLVDKAVSIGIWSGHDSNTFWEHRFKYGSNPLEVQTTYQRLLERWFTNSNFNPVYAIDDDLEVDENIDNSLETEFFGMSKFIAAQSTLCWDLEDEPFVSNFNIGNGSYFNWQGKRQHSKEWYNIGIQDYLPTWRWWWSVEPLGRESSEIPVGMKAELSWNDAWMGGSSLRISGSNSGKSVLHLFKTKFALEPGDVVTVRYKINSGTADCSLLMGMGEECDKWTDSKQYKVFGSDIVSAYGWNERQFVVSENDELAIIALQFENSDKLDVNIGEVSIARGEYPMPDVPTITRAEVLCTHLNGIDGKVIFDMNIGEGNNVGHYNIDHHASMYKLYVKVIYNDSEQVTHMGCTTSWAGIFFSAPMDVLKAEKESAQVQFGVSVVGLDMATESEICWSEPMTLTFFGEDAVYEMTDDVEVSDAYITDGESFSVAYKDSLHPAAAEWILNGPFGNPNFNEPASIKIAGASGFDAVAKSGATEVALQSLPFGFYNLTIEEQTGEVRTLNSIVHIYSEGAINGPKITDFVAIDLDDSDDAVSIVSEETAELTMLEKQPNCEFIIVESDGKEIDLRTISTNLPGEGIKMRPEDTLRMKYVAEADAAKNISKAVNLSGYSLSTTGDAVGVKADVTTSYDGDGLDRVTIDESKLDFSVAYWIKLTDVNDPIWMLNIRNPKDDWPYTDWGWIWGTVADDGSMESIAIRSHANNSYVYNFVDSTGKSSVKLEKGAWNHIAYVFHETKITESGFYGINTSSDNQFSFYLNGKLIEPVSVTEPDDKGWKDFDPQAKIALGGTAGVGTFAGYDAAIDNLQIYSVALDSEGVAKSMDDIDSPDDLPGLVGFWNFEGVDENLYANSVSAYPQAKLVHDYSELSVSTEDIEVAGYPGLRGSQAYDVKTDASIYVADGVAKIIETGVDDNGKVYGYADLTFPNPGKNVYRIYTAKLSLSNDVDNDEAEYDYIYVVDMDGKIDSGIVGVDSPSTTFIQEGDKLLFAVPTDDCFEIAIVKVDGTIAASVSGDYSAYEKVEISLPENNGIYIAVAVSKGKVIATRKVVK